MKNGLTLAACLLHDERHAMKVWFKEGAEQLELAAQKTELLDAIVSILKMNRGSKAARQAPTQKQPKKVTITLIYLSMGHRNIRHKVKYTASNSALYVHIWHIWRKNKEKTSHLTILTAPA